MERNQIETALDSHQIYVRVRNGNLWQVRRNGATKLWKTRPGEFRIPIKYGLKNHGEITHHDVIEMFGEGKNLGFVCKPETVNV
jgi:outer membrane protein assembly factor BamB